MSASEILRLSVSLVVLIGGLLVVRRWSRSGRPGRRVVGGTRVPIRIAGRAGIARGAHVAVIDVDGRRYLVGAGENGVTLLAELALSTDGLGVPETLSPFHDPAVGDDLTDDDITDAFTDPNASIPPRMGLVARLQRSTLRTADTSRPRAHPR
jgi:flagellar biogenesis protein FliO